MRRICVVTGLGVVAANAGNVSEFLASLRSGKAGIAPVSAFNTDQYCNKSAGVVKHSLNNNSEDGQTLDRATDLALRSAREAVDNSKIRIDAIGPERIATTVGTSLGGWGSYLDALRSECSAAGGTPQISSRQYIKDVSPSQIAAKLCSHFHISGGSITATTACAAGSNAITAAMDLIRHNRCDVVLACATDPLCELSYSGFNILMAMTSELCRPFDKDRSGLVVGEGAGTIIIEEREHALRRNAHIYCELAGYGLSNDAYHATQPDPQAGGACRAIAKAMRDAEVDPNDVEYINAHGTSTKYNDLMELTAIRKIYGDRASKIPISSIKSMIGHTLGAAGMIEAIATILALDKGFLPPTVNFNSPIQGFEFDFVPSSRPIQCAQLMASHSFGFGGNAACILFKKPKTMIAEYGV